MSFSIPKIYPITDTQRSGLSHLEQVKRLIRGGARFIQIRDKRATTRELYDSVRIVVEYASPLGVKIIVNDRSDIALAANADGVHLGQDDMSPSDARVQLGDQSIIGVSTHTLEQARAALSLPVDYIAFGPIFSTDTKENPDPIVGTELLRSVRRSVGSKPLVAIGGIDIDNLSSVFQAGADSAAVIGAVMAGDEKIERRMAELIDRSQ